MKQRTVVILGAGASMPAFDPPLTTPHLTEVVRDRKRWDALIKRYNKEVAGVNKVSEVAISQLLDDLDQYKTALNFEDIIEVVDKLSSYGFSSNEPKVYHVLIRVLKGVLADHPEHNWAPVPFLFRQLIAEEVERYHREKRAHTYQDFVGGLGDLLGWLLARGEVTVVSFNYDDVLPDAVRVSNVPLADGFAADRFSMTDFMQLGSCASFPHGHARFVMDDRGVRRLGSIKEANEHRLRKLYVGTGNETRYLLDGPNCYYFNTFLVTGRDKDTSFNRNPYAAYYQRLAMDLLDAHRVIIVGYSLGDPHINRLLINFRDLRSDNEIVIITLIREEIELIADFIDEDSSIHHLFQVFEVKDIPLKSTHPQPQYEFDDGIKRINLEGYGMLYPRILLFKKGIERFLSEYEFVLGG